MSYNCIEVAWGQGASEAVCVVRLNRPTKRNALNQRLVDELCDALSTIQADPQVDLDLFPSLGPFPSRGRAQVKVVVLTGNGQSFSAGVDLTDPVNALEQVSRSVLAWRIMAREAGSGEQHERGLVSQPGPPHEHAEGADHWRDQWRQRHRCKTFSPSGSFTRASTQQAASSWRWRVTC
jgi:enoyl-CoA hydratase/carnithine racemase